MNIYEWEQISLLDMRDFIVYWKRRAGNVKFPVEMSYSNWVEEFTSFNKDRQ